MLCSHCGICCQKTEMLLSMADIRRLERAGYDRRKFVRHDKRGFAKVRNKSGYCVFYDAEKNRCKVYKYRPLGCRIYPVILIEEEGIVADHICPMKDTVSGKDLERNGEKVVKLLKRIDAEAKKRAFDMKTSISLK